VTRVQLLLVLLAGLSAAKAAAQTSVDPDVSAIVSLGDWTTPGQEGMSRVIVRTSGFDHVTSSIQVEWLRQQGGELRVVAVDSAIGIPDRIDSLGVPEAYSDVDGHNFRICGTNAYDNSTQCWQFWVGAPGKISMTRTP
jgi:hypothetical protein